MTTFQEFLDFMSGQEVTTGNFQMNSAIRDAINAARIEEMEAKKRAAAEFYIELDASATRMREDLLKSLKELRQEATQVAKKLKDVTAKQQDLVSENSNGNPEALLYSMYGQTAGKIKLEEFANKIGVEV